MCVFILENSPLARSLVFFTTFPDRLGLRLFVGLDVIKAQRSMLQLILIFLIIFSSSSFIFITRRRIDIIVNHRCGYYQSERARQISSKREDHHH